MSQSPACSPASVDDLRGHLSEVKTIRLVTTENGELREDDEGEYYDDCPICQAMKLAEGRDLNPEELADLLYPG